MTLEHRKLLTIVTEAALEHELVRETERLGAHGYTITDARGKGSRGIRDAGGKLSASIRIEVHPEVRAALAEFRRSQTAAVLARPDLREGA